MFTFVQICSSYLFVFSLGFPGLLPGFLFYTKKLQKNFRSESPINIDFFILQQYFFIFLVKAMYKKLYLYQQRQKQILKLKQNGTSKSKIKSSKTKNSKIRKRFNVVNGTTIK